MIPAHPRVLSKMITPRRYRDPAYATGVGKALLAWTYPADEALGEWAARYQPLIQRTPGTITAVPRLAAELRAVRQHGYALDMEENEAGVRCVAVPIFLGRDVPAAAVSVTVLGSRAGADRLAELGEFLRRSLAEWSEARPLTAPRSG